MDMGNTKTHVSLRQPIARGVCSGTGENAHFKVSVGGTFLDQADPTQ